MSEQSPRYILPLLEAGQAQKEITHNEAIDRIDALLHLSVTSLSSAVPPAMPVPGSAWIVGAGASGQWAGHDGEIASFGAGGWRFFQAKPGCLAWVEDLGVFAVQAGGAWLSEAWPAKAIRINGRDFLSLSHPAIDNPQGGGIVDTEVRAVVLQILDTLRANALIAA